MAQRFINLGITRNAYRGPSQGKLFSALKLTREKKLISWIFGCFLCITETNSDNIQFGLKDALVLRKCSLKWGWEGEKDKDIETHRERRQGGEGVGGVGLREMQWLSSDIQDRIFSLSKEKNWYRDYLYPSKPSKFWRIRKVLHSPFAPWFFWFGFLCLSCDCWLTLSRTPGGVLEWTHFTQHTHRPLLPSDWFPLWLWALCPPPHLSSLRERCPDWPHLARTAPLEHQISSLSAVTPVSRALQVESTCPATCLCYAASRFVVTTSPGCESSKKGPEGPGLPHKALPPLMSDFCCMNESQFM